MKITDEEIKRISSKSILSHGLDFFKEGRIHLTVREDKKLVAVADGEEIYNVVVNFDDSGKVTDSFCTCPYYLTMNTPCKHIVATLKQRQKEMENGLSVSAENDRLVKLLFEDYKNTDLKKTHLNFAYRFNINSTPDGTKYSISVLMGEGIPEAVSGVEKFLLAFSGEGEYKITKFKAFNKEEYIISENDLAILEILSESIENKAARDMYVKKIAATDIGEKTVKRLMPYLIRSKCEFFINDLRLTEMQIRYENPDILIDIQALDSSITLSVTECGFSIVSDGSWFYFAGDIYRTDEKWQSVYMPIYRVLSGGERTKIEFTGDNRIAFATYALPELRTLKGVYLSGVDEIVISEKPEFSVYLDTLGLGISAVIIIKYGDIKIRVPDSYLEADKVVLRDTEAENQVMRNFSSFRLLDKKYILDDNDEIYNFITSGLERLSILSEIIESEKFTKLKNAIIPKIKTKVDYSKDSDLLRIDFESDMSDEEIKGILEAVKLRKSYYRNKKGKFYKIDGTEIMSLFKNLDFDFSDIASGHKTISKFYALYLDSIDENGNYVKGSEFSKLINDAKNIKVNIPKNIEKVLRNYQKDGVKWMSELSFLGLGGILADDMGLGKTLEVIAFVMSSSINKPSLVVAPTSLLYNWQSEIERFAPDAKSVIIDGNREERLEKLKDIKGFDFVITSYPLLRRDIDIYKDIEFSYCFIDEAQHIKNPKTLNAHSVKMINAGSKFALTGTPVENSLMELWSIFDFAIPGYLSKRKSFLENYEKPIHDGFYEPAELLRAKIKPFVLRRMKKDVLNELPDKIENTVYSEMTQKQKKVYNAYLSVARGEVDRILSEDGSQMMILSLLTRLRQICCHPLLFDENYDSGSGKLDLLLDLIKSAIDGGHRVLVFSQFTSMLKIIEKALLENEISSFYLDGKTLPSERNKLSDRFNRGEKDVFLISLKAGGTGLNLTGADTVIHYDPWWNPAVTDQASDRAYRIGQTKAVQVIKLASKGTIEERIIMLQEKKRKLADDFIIKNSQTISNLTKEELISLFDIKK